MVEAEKVTALKKAYADIILNTAKEAAARVMLSEKRAVRLQREILYTKDEALRMLLRLKQTYDSKVGEAAMKSMSQQGKIDELEAQLQEAEDIVSDLRGELNAVQDRLEKARKRRALERESLEINTTVQDNMSKDGRSSPELIISGNNPLADVVETNDMKSDCNGTYENKKSYVESDSLKDQKCIHDPDFASMIMRSKEPESYRNGCTQRIRAFETLGDDARHAAFEVNDEGKEMFVKPTAEFDDLREVEKNLVELNHRLEKEQPEIEVPAILSLGRKRKRTGRNRSASSLSTYLDHLPHQFTELQKDLSFCATPPNPVSNDGFTDISDKRSEVEVITPVSTQKSTSSSMETSSASACVMETDSDVQLTKPLTAQKETNIDNSMNGKTEFTTHQRSSAECLKVLACDSDLQKDESALEASHADDLMAGQSVSNTLLKYTFIRKRKKDCLSMPERASENGTMEENTKKTDIGFPHEEQSTLILESSQDADN